MFTKFCSVVGAIVVGAIGGILLVGVMDKVEMVCLKFTGGKKKNVKLEEK